MLERAAASLAYYKGYYMRGQGKWPAIDSWFDAMESRSTYLGTRSDYYTHCHDLPPQLGGREQSKQTKQYKQYAYVKRELRFGWVACMFLGTYGLLGGHCMQLTACAFRPPQPQRWSLAATTCFLFTCCYRHLGQSG